MPRTSLLPRAVAVLLASAFVCPSSAVLAGEPSAPQRQEARELMVDGRVRRHRGDLAGALESFRRADAIVAAPTTAFEVGATLIAMKRLLEAKDVLQRVVDDPVQGDEPEPFVRARREARGLLADLERRIPRIEVEIVGADSESTPVFVIDGRDVKPTSSGWVWQVDPGRHVVEVRIGEHAVRRDVSAGEGELERVVVRMRASHGLREAEEEGASTASAPEPRSRPLRQTGFWVGGAGLLVGSVAGGVAYFRARDVRAQCVDEVCPPTVQEDLDVAKDWANAATVGFGVALVGGAMVGLDLLLDDGGPPEQAALPDLRVGPTGATARWSFW